VAKRRGRGEGTITQRADGRWMARVDMGRGDDGRRLRKVVYGSTRAEAGNKLNALLGRSASGELLTTSTPTVGSWLKDWYATHCEDWRPSTQRVYRIAIDQWLVPVLGTVRLEQLKPATIQRWVNKATEDGASEKVRIAHNVLRSAMAWAMTQRVLTFNPASLVKVPRPVHRRAVPLSADQARKLLEFAGDDRLGGMFVLSLTLGLRIGEVSGLSWNDVDLDGHVLKVRQQVQSLGMGMLSLAPLKTASSRRTLSLPTLAVDALKARRKAQLEERMRAGADWKGSADNLVFTTEQGRIVHPSTVRTVLKATLTSAGLDATKFHTLRHTAATLLLSDGTPLFDVSRILGHAQISTTSDIYGHLVPDMTAGAATRMDSLLAHKGGHR
jgi:integrase